MAETALGGRPSEFYECYLEVAEKFDGDLLTAFNEDLNLILIPVSYANCVCVHALIPVVG